MAIRKSIKMLMLMALMGTATAMAAPVSQQRAAKVAELYVSQQYDAPAGLKVKTVEALNDQLYLVNFSPCGWAIVSSDDSTDPVVGYSCESSLSRNRMPDNMAFMMGEAKNTINMHIGQGDVSMTWSRIESGAVLQSRAGEPVDPLISVKWNQDNPYNYYCPSIGTTKTLVGCVAVAMSQAMSVQQYPSSPTGYASYGWTYGTLTIDYDKEAPYDWTAILNGDNTYREVARLLYHAGVSVSMDYGIDGSGIPSTQVYRISNALKDYFGYADDVTYEWRKSYRGDWNQLLLNELSAGRALVYNATDEVHGYGHSFNIDGYDGSLYHVNWGWGGTGNGYFNINTLSDSAMGYQYDSNHVAVLGIGAPNSALRSVALSDQYVETDQAANSPFCAVMVNGELASLGDFTIQVTGEYDSVDGLYAEVPFEYSNGLIYTTRALTEADNNTYLRIQVTDNESGVKIIQGFYITVKAPQALESRLSLTYDRASAKFRVKMKFGSKYTVKNSQGAVVASGEIKDDPYVEFNRAMLTTGDNTVEVTNGSKSKTLKIKL